MARNESVLLILDTTKFMFQNYEIQEENKYDEDKINFDIAKEAILMVYQEKLLYAGKSHKVSLMTYNKDQYSFLNEYETVSIDMAKNFREHTE
jgi:hypothetical protein